MRRGAADLRARLERLAPTGLDPDRSLDLAHLLHTAVPFDGWCLLGLDPLTGHRTFQFSRHGSEGTRELAHLEAGPADVNRYADLVRAEVPAGWLSLGHPDAASSGRLNLLLRPQGISSELRLVLRQGGRPWGAFVLYRRDSGRGFDDVDVSLVNTCGPAIATIARRHPARRQPPASALPAGVVLLDGGDRIVSVSAEAAEWLADLVPGGDDGTGLDDVTRVLFDAAQAVRSGHTSAVTVRTTTGRWLTVSASLVSAPEEGAALVLRASTARERLTVLARSRGLTRRELDVLDRLAEGASTKVIAARLGIGLWTTQDHLAAIYRKLSVRGRDELFALLVDIAVTDW